MPVTINIPSPLRRLSGGVGAVAAEGGTVGQALKDLEQAFPLFKGKLIDSNGDFKGAVKVYLTSGGGKKIAAPGDAVADGDEITLTPAAFGG